ncbi:hypothetical protein B9Z55_018301 [Caenorhabditis nigoni]|nr:hypothetical protein B9Z55_018301 [Caenorhabditis nigoni]
MSQQLSYRSIMGLPEYKNFEFDDNWIFYTVCAMIGYSILPIFIFLRIAFLFFTKKKKIQKTGLRMEILHSFLLMQFSNILLVIADFLMFRIPYTTIFTQFCASENPQSLLKFIVFFNFAAAYSSQLFTVLFCALRVAILFSVSQKTSEKIIRIVPFIIVTFGCLAALPHFSTDAFCMQMPEPMIYGSVLIISQFHASNKSMVYFNLVIYLIVTVTIAFLNILMVWRVRKKGSGGTLSTRSATQNAKIEKTLTGTMIILLFPMIASLLISMGEILRSSYFSYILLLRPFFLDARVHIVTCYFYLTHPIFRQIPHSSSLPVFSRATL